MRQVALVFLAMVAVLFMGAGIAGAAMELAARAAEGREFKSLAAVASMLFGLILFVICAFLFIRRDIAEMEKRRKSQEPPQDE